MSRGVPLPLGKNGLPVDSSFGEELVGEEAAPRAAPFGAAMG